jgi:predicted MFS family arabinose efflux permease
LGGLLAGAMSYRAMFILAVIIGVAGWILLRFAVREPRQMNSSTSQNLSLT